MFCRNVRDVQLAFDILSFLQLPSTVQDQAAVSVRAEAALSAIQGQVEAMSQTMLEWRDEQSQRLDDLEQRMERNHQDQSQQIIATAQEVSICDMNRIKGQRLLCSFK